MNATQYSLPSTSFNSTSFNPTPLPFERIDASESTPYAFLAFGTFISFLITLYIFYNEQDSQSPLVNTPSESKSLKDQNRNHNPGEASVVSVAMVPGSNQEDGTDDLDSPHKEQTVPNDHDENINNDNHEDPEKVMHRQMSIDKTYKTQGAKSCICCDCKYTKIIKWIVVIYQVISLVYAFAYTWRVASEAAPDKGQISWDNYQVFAKAFAISSHLKSVLTTAFVLLSKKRILKLKGKETDAPYDKSVMVYLFFFAVSCAFYGVSFFWTHLLPGIVIFCPLPLLGTAAFGIFYGIISRMGQQYSKNEGWKRDWIIWIGGLLCTITAVICVIVMEAMVMFWDKPDFDTWMDAVIIVFTQRDFEVFINGLSSKHERLANLIGMLL